MINYSNMINTIKHDTFLISICIPTYNRADCLKNLLDNIIAQVDLENPVEICISDNASTDNTAEMVAAYFNKYPYIIYAKTEQNLGFDKNILKAVSLAHGKYCWLLGDDDKIESRAFEYITAILKNNAAHELSGISVNVNFYDNSLTAIEHYELPIALAEDTLLLDTKAIFRNLFYHFCFISAQIVNRSLWNQVIQNKDSEHFYNGCIHLFVIGMIAKISPKWFYTAHKCVGARVVPYSGNAYERLAVTTLSYEQVAKYLFVDDKCFFRKLMSDICKTNIKYSVRSADARDEPYFVRKTFRLLFRHCKSYPTFWFNVLPWLLIPKSILIFGRFLYSKYKKLMKAYEKNNS